MFGQGKTRFGRELTNPQLYARFSQNTAITRYYQVIERLCAAEYVRINIAAIIDLVKPEEFGMNRWILICIICFILQSRGVTMNKAVKFCKRHAKKHSRVCGSSFGSSQ
jgi:hypothetical protein